MTNLWYVGLAAVFILHGLRTDVPALVGFGAGLACLYAACAAYAHLAAGQVEARRTHAARCYEDEWLAVRFEVRNAGSFPVIDLDVTLTDGSYHSVDSSDLAFRTAARIGVSEGLPQCQPVLLEPIHLVEIVCPTEATAKINAILSARRGQILGFDPGRYVELLPLAWTADGIAFRDEAGMLKPDLAPARRRALLPAWARRRRAGKPINVTRLVRAAFTFEGAARYGIWKVERHTGVAVPLTPWREKHPILAAPGVFWRVWRARAQTGARTV